MSQSNRWKFWFAVFLRSPHGKLKNPRLTINSDEWIFYCFVNQAEKATWLKNAWAVPGAPLDCGRDINIHTTRIASLLQAAEALIMDMELDLWFVYFIVAHWFSCWILLCVVPHGLLFLLPSSSSHSVSQAAFIFIAKCQSNATQQALRVSISILFRVYFMPHNGECEHREPARAVALISSFPDRTRKL
jgi:hypothetical protein